MRPYPWHAWVIQVAVYAGLLIAGYVVVVVLNIR